MGPLMLTHKCCGDPEAMHTEQAWLLHGGAGVGYGECSQRKAAGQTDLTWSAEGGVLDLTLN